MSEINQFKQKIFQKHLAFLFSICFTKNKKERNILINKMNTIQMNAVKNLVRAFLNSYHIESKNPKLMKKLKKETENISLLAEPVSNKNLTKKKKTLVQKGGFLLPLFASIIAPQIAKVFGK